MMKGILFEDLYKYTNKYWKDVKSRHVRPTTKTLADIAKASPETYNQVTATLVPFPGDHIIEQLGNAFKNISDTTYLLNQLYENPSSHLDENVVKFIVDESPERCGRYIANTEIPIVEPSELDDTEVDLLIIFAWNYSKMIIEKTFWGFFKYLVAFPSVQLVNNYNELEGFDSI